MFKFLNTTTSNKIFEKNNIKVGKVSSIFNPGFFYSLINFVFRLFILEYIDIFIFFKTTFCKNSKPFVYNYYWNKAVIEGKFNF